MTHQESQAEREADPRLLPCPCCNGVAVLTMGYATGQVWAYGDFHRVFCGSCQLRQLFYKTPEDAIEAWNRRAALPAAAPIVKDFLTVPPGMALVSISDLHAIDRAMQHMGDVLNEMDVVEEGDDDLAAPGFEAMERLIAAAPNHGASAATFTAS